MDLKGIYMYLLGACVMGASFAVFYMLIVHPVPADNKDVFNIAIGVLLGWGTSVVGYFYGSSKSSADKTEILKNQNQQP